MFAHALKTWQPTSSGVSASLSRPLALAAPSGRGSHSSAPTLLPALTAAGLALCASTRQPRRRPCDQLPPRHLPLTCKMLRSEYRSLSCGACGDCCAAMGGVCRGLFRVGQRQPKIYRPAESAVPRMPNCIRFDAERRPLIVQFKILSAVHGLDEDRRKINQMIAPATRDTTVF
jgi:hypothetical protein